MSATVPATVPATVLTTASVTVTVSATVAFDIFIPKHILYNLKLYNFLLNYADYLSNIKLYLNIILFITFRVLGSGHEMLSQSAMLRICTAAKNTVLLAYLVAILLHLLRYKNAFSTKCLSLKVFLS